MKRDNKNKQKLLILIVMFLVLFSYVIVISQTTGSTKTENIPGGAGEEAKEEHTRAGAETIQDEGKTVTGKKQDLGGLVGIEKPSGAVASPSEPSLSGKNVNFKRDLEAKEGKQKVDITPTERNSDNNEIELNGNKFNMKESTTGSDLYDYVTGGFQGVKDSKISVEKKDSEKFAETGSGTEYTVKGEDKTPEENFGDELYNKLAEEDGIDTKTSTDELAGREVKMSSETEVKITEDKDGKRKVDMKVPKGGEINEPEDRKNGKEEEGKETNYRWFGENMRLFSKGEPYETKGEVFWNQNLGFYTKSKLEINNNNIIPKSDKEVQLFFGKLGADEENSAKGPFAYIIKNVEYIDKSRNIISKGDSVISSGSGSSEPGPFINAEAYSSVIQDKKTFVKFQGGSNSEVRVTINKVFGDTDISVVGDEGYINIGDKILLKDKTRVAVFESSRSSSDPYPESGAISFLNKDGEYYTPSGTFDVKDEENKYGYLAFDKNGEFSTQIGDKPLTKKYLNQAFAQINQDLEQIRKNMEEMRKNLEGTTQQIHKSIQSSRVEYNTNPNPGIIPTSPGAPIQYNTPDDRTTFQDNFIVNTPKGYSDMRSNIINTAESARTNIAKEWLGSELPSGQGRTNIQLNVKQGVNMDGFGARGITGVSNDPKEKFYRMYVDVDPSRINQIDSTITHEIAHTILAAKYPASQGKRLSSWVEEAVASRYDEQGAIDQRKDFMTLWARGIIPFPNDYQEVIRSTDPLGSKNTNGYIASESTLNYLLTISPEKPESFRKQSFLNFADYSRDHGVDVALQKYYNIQNTGQLERYWKQYITNTYQNRKFSDPEASRRFD